MKDFFTSILSTITNFFQLIVDFWTGLFDYINEIIIAVVDFGSNIIDSSIAFIKDLPVLIINLLFSIIESILDLFPSVCDYCFSDLVPDLKFNWSLLLYSGDMGQSLCYVLSQIKYDTALQTLSCGAIMWCVLRVVSLIRG
jgi:hypothetical protein